MREDIQKNLDYLELGEDTDICSRVSLIREYIKEIVLKNEFYEELISVVISK